ncbi:hypothetical protein PHLGIDRAFT_146068 [Phlebiopsis gigantea 11061_1 CR5-6]|uniref:Uncharacterized protein n=1 Tax=Phlebiopsis gigantea (strain 11061_1 CR5-6) TaxID=745531 RepID=A0A0C3NKN7_PHLG1|nr:hypothetical protein PHLGIDRAFT_146068 [Phlebiopsis gigantea 11061_1 CR5-6]
MLVAKPPQSLVVRRLAPAHPPATHYADHGSLSPEAAVIDIESRQDHYDGSSYAAEPRHYSVDLSLNTSTSAACHDDGREVRKAQAAGGYLVIDDGSRTGLQMAGEGASSLTVSRLATCAIQTGARTKHVFSVDTILKARWLGRPCVATETPCCRNSSVDAS